MLQGQDDFETKMIFKALLKAVHLRVGHNLKVGDGGSRSGCSGKGGLRMEVGMQGSGGWGGWGLVLEWSPLGVEGCGVTPHPLWLPPPTITSTSNIHPQLFCALLYLF